MNKKAQIDMALKVIIYLIIGFILLVLIFSLYANLMRLFQRNASTDAKFCIDGIDGLTQHLRESGNPSVAHSAETEAETGSNPIIYCRLDAEGNERIISGKNDQIKGCDSNSLCVVNQNRVLYKKTIYGVDDVLINQDPDSIINVDGTRIIRPIGSPEEYGTDKQGNYVVRPIKLTVQYQTATEDRGMAEGEGLTDYTPHSKLIISDVYKMPSYGPDFYVPTQVEVKCGGNDATIKKCTDYPTRDACVHDDCNLTCYPEFSISNNEYSYCNSCDSVEVNSAIQNFLGDENHVNNVCNRRGEQDCMANYYCEGKFVCYPTYKVDYDPQAPPEYYGKPVFSTAPDGSKTPIFESCQQCMKPGSNSCSQYLTQEICWIDPCAYGCHWDPPGDIMGACKGT